MNTFGIFKKKGSAEPEAQLAAQTPGPGEKMVVFSGLNMHCAGCQALIRDELREVPGARYINVALKEQSATVIFDPAQTGLDALRTAISQAGYKARSEKVLEG